MEELEPGTEVTRGPDWRWGDQDGTPGSVGIITGRDTAMPDEEGWHLVEWPDGHKNGYQYNKEKKEIIRFKRPKPIKEPEEVTVKIKRMDKSDFKNALKGLK